MKRLLLVCMMILGHTASATIINIPADYPTIQQGIDASTDGDTVLVHPGTYMENVSIYEKSVILASNFVYSNDTLDIVNTVVEGDSSNPIMFDIQNTSSFAQLIGLTIRNCDGCIFTDAAIRVSGAKVENCVIENISGRAINASNTEIFENKIRNNDDLYLTGVMYCGDQVVVQGNEIYNNNCQAIMALYGDDFRAEDNRIYNNTGIIFWCRPNSFPAIIRRNVIYNNHCNYWHYGGIFNAVDTYVYAENNVIFNNTGAHLTHLARFRFAQYGTTVEFINNIIWDNSYSESSPLFIISGYIDFSMIYSDIQGGWPGEGNIECDPQFCDPDSGNFYLDGNSCCIEAGQNGADIGALGAGCWSACSTYVVGDVNGSGAFDGLDIVYGVAYLKSGPAPKYVCECAPGNIFYAAGDVNGSCSYNGLDITYGVAFFKGGATPIPCQDCPPAG